MNENAEKCPVCGTETKDGRCPRCGMPVSATELEAKREEDKRLAQQLYDSAVQCVLKAGSASTSLLQRHLHIGYVVAATIMDMMEENGVVGPYCGARPREVLLPLPNESPSFQDSFDIPIQPFPDEQPSSQPCLQPPVKTAESSRSSTHRPTVRLTLTDLDRMDGQSFEHACSKILSSNAFSHVKVTQASGDYGIDILAERNGRRYAIQCKCYNSPVGNHAIEEAYAGAAYYDGRIPVVMTNQSFTKAALQMAKKLNVLLWGRAELQKMLIVYNNVPLWKRALLSVLKLLFGSVSSFIATIICLFGLYDSFLSFDLQRLPSDLLYCVASWLILKGILVVIGNKLLHNK